MLLSAGEVSNTLGIAKDDCDRHDSDRIFGLLTSGPRRADFRPIEFVDSLLQNAANERCRYVDIEMLRRSRIALHAVGPNGVGRR
jgi:hypothetical protein